VIPPLRTDTMLEANMAMRIGIDLGGTKIELVALDGSGRVLLRRRRPTPQGDYEATVKAVAELVGAAERELGQPGSVGIGIPGAESSLNGRDQERKLDLPDWQCFAA
jgi:fructokinase